MRVATAYVALGSNLGDRHRLLEAALRELEALAGVRVLARSRIYETAPEGPPPQRPYLNAVVSLETDLGPRALLEQLLAIEQRAGRIRDGRRNAPRTLDLDLLLYGNLCFREEGLEVPHPRMHLRAFVLEPLRELAADLVHPGLGVPIRTLAERVRARGAVHALEPDEEERRAGWPSSP